VGGRTGLRRSREANGWNELIAKFKDAGVDLVVLKARVSVREAWNVSKSAHGRWRISQAPA
jgi:hypothetical protein